MISISPLLKIAMLVACVVAPVCATEGFWYLIASESDHLTIR